MSHLPSTAFLLLLAFGRTGLAASQVALYTDADCRDLASNVTASNGYPDGECTGVWQQVSENAQSFQFLSLDTGCSATVYQASSDDDCSGYPILAAMGTCYNSSWGDFSVDMCTQPAASGNASAAANATVTSSAPSATALSTTARATTTPSPSTTGASAPSSTASANGAFAGTDGPALARSGAGTLGLGAAVGAGIYVLLL